MGLFDNLLKTVESGELEKRLHKVADTLERTTQRAEKTLGSSAEKPAQVLKTAETKAKDIEQRTAKSLDAIKKKD